MTVWNRAPLSQEPVPQSQVVDVQQLLDQLRKSTSLPPLGLGSTQLHPRIIWHLWTARNLLIFETRLFS